MVPWISPDRCWPIKPRWPIESRAHPARMVHRTQQLEGKTCVYSDCIVWTDRWVDIDIDRDININREIILCIYIYVCHVDRSGWWVNNEIPMGVLVHLFFCLEMAMLGCMQSRNMRNSDERDAVWHSNLDFPNFSSKKSTCPLHFCSLPTWFNRPEDAGAGQAPPAPVKKRKSSGTPKEKAAAAGCSWSKSLDVGWVACGRWVHYGWTMPGWSIDVLVHQFHGARLFLRISLLGYPSETPKCSETNGNLLKMSRWMN